MHGPAQPQPVHGASHCPVLCDRTCQHANHARICHCCCCRTYNRLPHNTPPRHEELASGRPQTISQLGSYSAIPCSTGSITLQQSILYNYLTTYKPRSCCAIQTPLKQRSSYAPSSTLPCTTTKHWTDKGQHPWRGSQLQRVLPGAYAHDACWQCTCTPRTTALSRMPAACRTALPSAACCAIAAEATP